MKLLIDTNILIPLEPTDLSDIEAGTQAAVRFARLALGAGHQLYVHPLAKEDIGRDRREARRALRQIQFGKYPKLPDAPCISPVIEAVLGRAAPRSNDWVDHHLLAALHADAVDFLITEDIEIHRKAARLKVRDRVATVMEAISIIQDLSDTLPPPPPAVLPLKAHALNSADPIFRTLREDYPDFDQWLTKCKREQRQAFVVEAGGPYIAAFCIIKQEPARTLGLDGKILKLCSFKVSDGYNGLRFGELLLKAVFSHAHLNRYDWVYTTVFEKHTALIALLEDFGFQTRPDRTSAGEIILAKPMSFTAADYEGTDALAFNIRYGPFAAKIRDAPAFLVPIKPRYHRLLFPEAEQQLELLPGNYPFGNSLRKAYLSNSPIRTITPGASLLFYRSEDAHAATSLGVTEGTLVSSSAVEVARYVGKRTVYRFTDIQGLCQKPVLAILFRQSLILKNPIRLPELKAAGVVAAAPQSILPISEGAREWLHAQIRA